MFASVRHLAPLLSVITLVTALAAAALAACAGAPPPPVRISLSASAPMGGLDDAGRPRGFVVDTMNAAAERARVAIAWVPMGDYATNNAALRTGGVDIVVGVGTAERRREFFASEPWWSVELVAIVPADRGVRDEAGLRGLRLAVPLGLGSDVPVSFQPAALVRVPNAAAVARAVCDQEADAGIIAAMYLRQLLFGNSGACTGVRMRTIDLSTHMDYVLLATPEAAPAALALRQAIDAITADGTLTAIAARHPPVSTPQAIDLAEVLTARYARSVWKMTALVASAGAVAAVGFVFVLVRGRRRLAVVNARLEHDIRARLDAEAALRESEARFKTLVDAAPDAVCVEEAGRFVFVNAAMLRILGAEDPSRLLDRPWLECVAEPDRAGAAEWLGGTDAQPASAATRELRWLRSDGAVVHVEATAVRIVLEGRAANLVFARDTTARRVLEQDRERLRDELQHVQKMESVGRLAGGVAHDFNNLLTVQLGYCDTLRRELRPEDPIADGLNEIAQCAQRAAGLTSQLLAFSRRQKLQPVDFDLGERVRGLMKMLRRLLGEDLEIAFSADAAPVFVRADPGQIDQILINLAVNARDAMPDGGRLTLRLEPVAAPPPQGAFCVGELPDPAVALSVADTGCGMDADTLHRIFEPFYTTKAVGKGTGLGLATVYGIVMQSGGALAVQSAAGQGSTFTVYLPRVAGRMPAEASVPEPVNGGRGERVLLVEDEPSLRRLVALALVRLGYRVEQAADGADALRLVGDQGIYPDVLVTDVIMPRVGGRALAEQLRAAHPELLVVFMSGYTDNALTAAALSEPGTRFIQKPFSLATLGGTLRDLLAERSPSTS